MTSRYKVICSCECFIYAKSMHSSLLTWRDCRLKHPKDIIHNAQNRKSGEISSRIFETYENVVRPNSCHIFNTAADMVVSTMFQCTYKQHGISH